MQSGFAQNRKKYFMEKTESEGLFDYYSVEIRMTEEHFSYYFEIETECFAVSLTAMA